MRGLCAARAATVGASRGPILPRVLNEKKSYRIIKAFQTFLNVTYLTT